MAIGGLLAQHGMKPVDESQLPGKRATSNVRGALYPRLLPDNRAIFLVKAADARRVQLDLGKLYDLEQTAEGMWTCTTEPLSEGFHYYSLVIDGVSVADPASESYYGCGRMSSGIEVPYPEGVNPYERADVPQGDIREHYYYSTLCGKWKRIFVYVPADYRQGDKSYPVLYLLHGGGEDERGWSTQGRAGIILDNLIAAGRAVPMLIAMPDGNSTDFEGELTKEFIPFVERTYRAKADRAHRALAGLSMGGIQTLNAGIMHPELFAYLGVFSSGWLAHPPQGVPFDNNMETYYERLRQQKDAFNQGWKEFWLSMGGKEDIAYQNCQTMRRRLDEIGIRYTYFETPGGHTWPVWRVSLYRFAPLLFR